MLDLRLKPLYPAKSYDEYIDGIKRLMCGITGFWDQQKRISPQQAHTIAQDMGRAIAERGPDSWGVWQHPGNGLVFSHRRLSIVDLSPLGHQPMISKSGRTILSYNGEIYNTDELRRELELKGLTFRGTSDTEVIVEACELWGVKATTEKLIGMFAFSVWCEQSQKLYLVRDRLGKKPLYWGWQKGTLFFGSQLKSFFKHPHWQGILNKDVLPHYFQYNYVPAPWSIFKDIYKLKPGHILSVDSAGEIHEEAYWSLDEVIIDAQKHLFQGTDHDAIEALDHLLGDAVKRRMMADVPLGAFLSGGIDSSVIVALMQAQSASPVKTFSIGFNEAQYNEANYAKAIAAHLKTDHTELYLSMNEAADIIPSIPEWCDEPFADSSQIPTYLVSKLAREHVTVSLSGDGGDELFAGYNRYHQGEALWRKAGLLSPFVRRMMADGISAFSPQFWDKWGRLIPSSMRPNNVGHKAHILADVLRCQRYEDYYHRCVSFWPEPERLMASPHSRPSRCVDEIDASFLRSPVEKMQYWDTLTYLPDDILVKVDRASMAVSLESRVPFLDHRVVAFSWSLPMSMKIRDGQGKWVLKQVLDRYVPRHLIDRPKMGFGIPLDEWLRGGLKDWANQLITPHKLNEQGILDPALINARMQEHTSGQRNWPSSLWGVLMFQAWLEKWKDGISYS